MDEEFEVGGQVDEASVTLAIYGETLRPGEVSLLLGVEPTSSFEAGYKRAPRSSPSPHGAWFYAIRGKAPLGVEDLMSMLFARAPIERSTWNRLSEQYRVRFRVALHMESGNRGFGLSHATLRKLADTGAAVTFDVYAYDDGDP